MVKNNKLPNEIIPFLSNDKDFHEKPDQHDLANFPSPFNMIICGNRNVDKTRVCKNILIHKNPPYDRIVIYTPLEETHEYDDIDVEYINDIPSYDFFDRNDHNLFIVEDCDTKQELTREQRTRY